MTSDRFKIYAAAFLILKKENKILLHRRKNSGFCDGLFDVVSGHLDGEETTRETAAREALEEAGVVVKIEDLKFVHLVHNHLDKEYFNIYFQTEKWEGEARNMEEDKSTDTGWYNINKLPKDIAPHVKAALENIQKGIYYSEFGWSDNHWQFC